MRRAITLVTAIVFAGMVCVIEGGNALAQTGCSGQRTAKLTAQKLIVQRDIQAAFDQQIEEFAAKDLDAATRLMPSDFSIRLLDGTTLNRRQAIEGMRQETAGVLSIDVDRTYTRIERLSLVGKEATVYTKQQYVRMVPDRKDGSPHEVITSVKHRETWVYTKEGWVAKRVEEIEQGQTYLDGEPYDPR